MATFAESLAAILGGAREREIVVNALREANSRTFDAARLDHLDELAKLLGQPPMATFDESHLLRAEYFLYRSDTQLAAASFRQGAGRPPRLEVVLEMLEARAVGFAHWKEEEFFDEALAALPAGRARSELAAHIAAIHLESGLDDDAAKWFARAAEEWPSAERVPALEAYFAKHGLNFALAGIRR